MPELRSNSTRLARGVVRELSTCAVPRAGDNGLPLMWAASRIPSGKYRAGAARSFPRETRRRLGSGVGSFRSNVRGRNVARLSLKRGAGKAVRELLDRPRSATSGFKPTEKATRAVK